MIVLLLLIPLSILVAGGFLAAFIWAVRTGQFDDTCTPAMRPLIDEQWRNPAPIPSAEPLANTNPDNKIC